MSTANGAKLMRHLLGKKYNGHVWGNRAREGAPSL
jgi:hypothetical protein